MLVNDEREHTGKKGSAHGSCHRARFDLRDLPVACVFER
jgi:hypothetical protein